MEIPKKAAGAKTSGATDKTVDKNKAAAKTAAKAEPIIVPPMCRRVDWLALGITFLITWIIYLWTLAPQLTLEDSGELCTASYYAGIPHPPGYPFWTLYSWFWTFILPFNNVAWRVAVGQSFAGALGCGMLALMVSRGSSMLIEGIETLKGVASRWENAICLVSGVTAGLLLALDGFMWSESVVVNRISVFGVPWLIAVMLCLMRWMYAPQQRRYLYLALLLYGICATIHQTLLLGAVGLEVLICLVDLRLGRDIFVVNSLFYLIGYGLLRAGNIPALNDMSAIELDLFHLVGIGSLAAAAWLITKTGQVFTEWKPILIMAGMWILGVSFYLYMPVSGMTVPPMQWGYPRTVEGFFHALSRGQYGGMTGTGLWANPHRAANQMWYVAQGLSQGFSWVFVFIGLLPFFFLHKMNKRDRGWIIGLTATYLCISVLLVRLLDVSPDRSTSDLNRVFFIASHALFALMIGYGMTILAAYMATHYAKFRRWGVIGGVMAVLLAIYCLTDAAGILFFGPAGGFRVERDFLAGLIALYALALLALAFVKSLQKFIAGTASVAEQVFTIALPGLPLLALVSSWIMLHLPGLSDSSIEFWSMPGEAMDATGQFFRDFLHSPAGMIHSDLFHWIGQAFAPYQYGLPVFANLLLLLLPLAFIAALAVYRTRGPVLVLLGLFLMMPVYSGMIHWYKSEQRNHWFGYWFGHDMFTPPFMGPDGKLTYDNELRARLLKEDPKNAKLIYPEMTRDTILFGGTDPGRFCPTYIIFCESFIPHRCQPNQDQKFDRRDVYIITQNALADGTYLDYLRSQYNRSKQEDPPFFSRLFKYACAVLHLTAPGTVATDGDRGSGESGNALIDGIASVLDFTLDKPFMAWGRHVESYRRARGVYPPSEIYIPSPEDAQRSFLEYKLDFERRAAAGQLQPGEGTRTVDGRIAVAGQVSVMKINGLLCKVIFDHAPTNEFYVEESMPIDWMYPHETPFGIIMKINRNPLPELSQDVFDLDHKFWTDFSTRLCGNWITYDTPLKDICDFAERTYIRNNFTGYTGSRAFVRDDDAQKAFSKLRSSQAGMYAWRCGPSCPPEFRQKTPATQAALIRETDFAFKQAFAFCPYSPEAIFRYVNFLWPLGRIDDALLIAQTGAKFDPFNQDMIKLVNSLQSFKEQTESVQKNVSQLNVLEKTAKEKPDDTANLMTLGLTYAQTGQTNRAAEIFDKALASASLKPEEALHIASYYSQINDLTRLAAVFQRLTVLTPDLPDPHYSLAELQAHLGNPAAALTHLKTALELNARQRATNPSAPDLLGTARKDPNLNPLRSLPEFQKLVPP